MSVFRRHPVILNVLVIAVTIVFVAVALLVGRGEAVEPPVLVVGQPAPQTFIATEQVAVVDEAATANETELARLNVETVRARDGAAEVAVVDDVGLVFARAEIASGPRLIPEAEDPADIFSTVPDATSTTGSGLGTGEDPAPLVIQIDRMNVDYADLLSENTIITLLAILDEDRVRLVEGQRLIFPDVEEAALAHAAIVLEAEIFSDELSEAKTNVRRNPPAISVPGLSPERREEARAAIADIVSTFLQPNVRLDEDATEEARAAAVALVEDVEVTYQTGQEIVGQAQIVNQVQADAIEKLGLLEPEEAGESPWAVITLGALAVLLTAFFLWRIAPAQWSQPKHFALLGVLLVLAALASRVPDLIADQNAQLAYAIPAVMFGYMAAILYEPRTAVLMAVPVATFTAISTGDPALTVFAGAATVAPVAFVSSVSSRRQLRIAVALSAAVLAPLAFATAWLFTGIDTAVEAAVFAFLGGLLAGLVAQGLLSFLENLFNVTTTVTLLDLTDRNHPALRLIEEQAPGTFNHSILVGTLAGKAARAIDADPLYAQAAAFYHDLGKVRAPQYFIENQFGVSNPHDDLPPEESAAIIRAHVSEGLKLARQYRIPPDVADGIRMHHGTGLMRYFYHKALEDQSDVDPRVYRHLGAKPQRKELAILMISDACEGAARALAQQEDPSADSLAKLVDSVVGEKLEDGQLDESDLTFGDLTKVKRSIVDALIGYYHTRIAYPGFPGTDVESP
jgi:putative nucleotidyltransferase with HDIG domain